MFKVVFKGKQIGEIALERSASLLAAAAQGQVPLTHSCGGHARCGTCLVAVEQGEEHLSPMGPVEARVLQVLRAGPGHRLSCQAWAEGDVVCRIDGA
jgi:ferredoxin